MKGAPHVTIFSNHSALTSLCKKELIKIENMRLVTMLERLSDFNYKIRHLAKNADSDYLSRHNIQGTGSVIPQGQSLGEGEDSEVAKLTGGCLTVESRRGNQQLPKHLENNRGNQNGQGC